MKTVFAFIVTILIMVVIFSGIDIQEFKDNIETCNWLLFIFGVLFFIPQVLISAYRWKIMIQDWTHIGLWESCKLLLACNAINILVPSRVGDLSKAYFIAKEDKLDIKRGMNVVLFEKYIDLSSLGIVVLTGVLAAGVWNEATLFGLAFGLGMLAIFPVLYFVRIDKWVGHGIFEKWGILRKIRNFLLDSQVYLEELKKNKAHLVWVVSISVFLWFIHILQFFVIFRALHSQVSIFHVFSLVPLAILVGLVPLTVAGVGTRDSAMIYFFAPYEAASKIVGVGLFSTLRYFIPGLLGLPFLNTYIVKKSK